MRVCVSVCLFSRVSRGVSYNRTDFPLYCVPGIFCERWCADKIGNVPTTQIVFRERLYKRKQGNQSLPCHFDGDERFESSFLDRQDIRN